MNRRLWHDNKREISRTRHFVEWAIPAAISAAGLGMSMFGKKKQTEDPLAGIRQQLVDLSAGVPALVARQKEEIAKLFQDYQKTGQENIQENVHAERGMGRSSIESRLNTELMDKLFKGQSAAELEADKWGINTQGALLGKAGSFAQASAEEPDILSGLFDAGLSLAGQELGYQRQSDLLTNLYKPQESEKSFVLPSLNLDLREGVRTSGGPTDIDWSSVLQKYPNLIGDN